MKRLALALILTAAALPAYAQDANVDSASRAYVQCVLNTAVDNVASNESVNSAAEIAVIMCTNSRNTVEAAVRARGETPAYAMAFGEQLEQATRLQVVRRLVLR